MRKLLLFLWVLIPFPVVAYHLGAGQEQQKLDKAAQLLAEARVLGEDKDFQLAVARYEEALKELPADRKAEMQVIRLERAKAQLQAKGLAKANAELISLVDELRADKSTDPALLADAQRTLANSQYYLTWLMRLEGVDRAEWEPEIEAARQTYKMLAATAASSGNAEAAKRDREDLEAAIRLARMDIKDLQGLPLPNQ